jgi:hypothetical protein
VALSDELSLEELPEPVGDELVGTLVVADESELSLTGAVP